MCGIFGIINHTDKIPTKTKEKLLDGVNLMCALSESRGTDSTGVAVGTVEGEATIYKNITHPLTMIRNPVWRQLIESADGFTTILGHTRKKSVGAVTLENAHPFIFPSPSLGTLVGVHNGNIFNHTALGPEEGPFENDSKNMFYRMSTVSLDSLPDFLYALNGAVAVAFMRRGETYLYRNYTNPLSWALAKDKSCTIFASEQNTIRLAAALAGIDIGEITLLETYRLYRFEPNEHRPWVYTVAYRPGNPYNYNGFSPGQFYQSATGYCRLCRETMPVGRLVTLSSGARECHDCYMITSGGLYD